MQTTGQCMHMPVSLVRKPVGLLKTLIPSDNQALDYWFLVVDVKCSLAAQNCQSSVFGPVRDIA